MIALTSFLDDDKVFPAVRAGAAGYLLKDVEPAGARAGDPRGRTPARSLLHPAVTARLMEDVRRRRRRGARAAQALTPREREVARADRARAAEQADRAASSGIAEKTVKTHVSSILRKLDLTDRTQAALYAVREGWARRRPGPRPDCRWWRGAPRARSVERAWPTAIVTGASRGLGLALARALAERGWRLVIDARDAADLTAARDELAELTEVVALAGDVADEAHRRDLVAAAGARPRRARQQREHARPEPAARRWPTTRSTALERVYRVNVVAPLALAQLALPRARRAAARIVNVTSDAAVEPYEGWGGYGSSKAALEQLTRDPGGRASRAARLRRRPRRHAHADAPGGLPRRGHLGPARRPRRAFPACCALIDGELPSGRYRGARAGGGRRA